MNKTIIVPINVQAFCIGEGDIDKRLCKPDADFTQLPYVSEISDAEGNIDTPYYSESVLNTPLHSSDKNVTAQDVGVHLHWSLPEALKHAKQADGETMGFPAVPNRWLVTRMTNNQDCQQWVIASDYIEEDVINERCATTIPYRTKDRPKSTFKTLGRAYSLSDWQEKKVIKPFAPLTALGYGSLSFSSFYQNSKTVFGFHDDSLQNYQGILSYVVIGWYSDEAKDFVGDSLSNIKQWFNDNDWQLQGNDVLDSISSSIYHGFVSDIHWAREASHMNANIDSDVDLNIAPSGIETLSSYLAKTALGENAPHETIKNMELHLNALQLNKTENLSTVNSLNDLYSNIHKQRFNDEQSGLQWVIKAYRKNSIDEVSGGLGVLEDNLESQSLLQALNILQEKLDTNQAIITQTRWQIFVDWCKYLSDKRDKKIQSYIEEEILHLEGLQKEQEDIIVEKENTQKALKELLSNLSNIQDNKLEYYLVSVPASFFYVPKDPVLLIKTPWKFADERNSLVGEKSLLVRTDDQLIELDNNRFNIQNKDTPCEIINKILNEADVLINSPEKIRENMILPAKLSMHKWEKNPWLPLKVQWEVNYAPLKKEFVKKSENYKYQDGYIKENFTLSEDPSEPEMIVTKDLAEGMFEKQQHTPYRGEYFISYGETSHLLNVISEQFLDDHDDAWQEISAKVQKANFYAISLDGLLQRLIMHKKIMQLDVYDPLASHIERTFCDKVKNAVQDLNRTSPSDENTKSFFPVLAGALRVAKIRVVDVFGQYIDIDDKETITSPSFSKVSIESKQYIFMAPRLNSPAQISFKLLESCKKNNIKYMTNHPNSNSIFGWLVANELEKSIMLYGASGNALGSFFMTNAGVHWQSAPGLEFTATVEEVFQEYPEISNLARTIQSQSKEYFTNLINALYENYIHPENITTNNGLLSNPIALVRAAIGLRLQGGNVANESRDSFKIDIESKKIALQNRENDDFLKVKFPVKLGSDIDKNDGLIGYFVNKNSLCEIDYDNFNAVNNDDSLIYCSILNKDKYLTLLWDPRCPINIKTSILPLKQIDLPKDKYIPAMNNINITLSMGPIISDSANVILPIKSEQSNNAMWRWIENQGGKWINKKIFDINSHVVNNEALKEIKEGWLQLIKNVDKTDGR